MLFRSGSGTLSTFKVVLVQALMAKSGLFEGTLSKGDHSSTLEKLNGLIRDFAGGIVEQLRPGPDGTLELRVKPVSGGESFSFDGKPTFNLIRRDIIDIGRLFK